MTPSHWTDMGGRQFPDGTQTRPDGVQTGGVACVDLDLVSGTGEQRSRWAIEALLSRIAGAGRS